MCKVIFQYEHIPTPDTAIEGCCLMDIGNVNGSVTPCNLSLISFIAIENSSLSILPSAVRSANSLKFKVFFC